MDPFANIPVTVCDCGKQTRRLSPSDPRNAEDYCAACHRSYPLKKSIALGHNVKMAAARNSCIHTASEDDCELSA